jgi:hypothetical protein
VSDQPLQDGRREQRLALGDGSHRVDEPLAPGVLEQEPLAPARRAS